MQLPVEALGEKSKQHLLLSPLSMPFWECMHVTLTLLTIGWLRGEMSDGYDKEGATE